MNIVLNGYLSTFGDDLIIIEGEAPGADHLSGLWAEHNGLTVANGRLLKFPAHWKHHQDHTNSCEPWCVREDCLPDCKQMVGRAAGAIRNKRQLIEGKPEYGAAFHDDLKNSKGTANMCGLMEKAHLPTVIIGQFWRSTAQLF
jgi:hypothetical protein